MDTNKMRHEFEAAYTAYCEKMGIMFYTAFHRAREVYVSSVTELAWQMWQASRESVVVELNRYDQSYGCDEWYESSDGMMMKSAEVLAAIEAQGLKVAP